MARRFTRTVRVLPKRESLSVSERLSRLKIGINRRKTSNRVYRIDLQA